MAEQSSPKKKPAAAKRAKPVVRERRSSVYTNLSAPLEVKITKTKGLEHKPESREICEKKNRRRKTVVPPIDKNFAKRVLNDPDFVEAPSINHTPTPESRLRIAKYVAFGVSVEAICRLENFSYPTLMRHYRHEIEVGRDYINFLVANSLMQQALAGNTTAQIFYLKTRNAANFRESQHIVHEIEAPETSTAKERLLGTIIAPAGTK